MASTRATASSARASALTTVDPDLKNPYAHNWFVGVQREIGLGIVADVELLGSAGRNLYNAYNINRFIGDLLDGPVRRLQSELPAINMVTSTSQSDYHGATLQLRRNFQQGFMLQGAYTFGKAMNDADIAVGTTAFQDAADIGAEWAIAGYDVRHKLALVGLWEMPFFRNSSRHDADARSAAGSSPGRRSSRPATRSTSPTAARSRAATSTPTATAAIGRTLRRPA